jgi:hypothetical protein
MRAEAIESFARVFILSPLGYQCPSDGSGGVFRRGLSHL